MNVDVDVLGYPSLIVLTVSVGVKQHLKKKFKSPLRIALAKSCPHSS